MVYGQEVMWHFQTRYLPYLSYVSVTPALCHFMLLNILVLVNEQTIAKIRNVLEKNALRAFSSVRCFWCVNNSIYSSSVK